MTTATAQPIYMWLLRSLRSKTFSVWWMESNERNTVYSRRQRNFHSCLSSRLDQWKSPIPFGWCVSVCVQVPILFRYIFRLKYNNIQMAFGTYCALSRPLWWSCNIAILWHRTWVRYTVITCRCKLATLSLSRAQMQYGVCTQCNGIGILSLIIDVFRLRRWLEMLTN